MLKRKIKTLIRCIDCQHAKKAKGKYYCSAINDDRNNLLSKTLLYEAGDCKDGKKIPEFILQWQKRLV